MKTVTIHEAKTNLSKYIDAAKRGEKIYIGNRGKPEIRLAVDPGPGQAKRTLGPLANSGLTSLEFDEYDKDWQEIIDMMNNGPLFYE
jgi:antitoxin (DNA-binding transcriptional repressor) of toxin-antitoxin stability system